MTATPGFMIDSPDTRDRDDALWVSRGSTGWDVVVHIADVTAHVPTRGSVEQRAARQGRTVYRRLNGFSPMLPNSVVHAASLHPQNGEQKTCAISFHVTNDGDVHTPVVNRGTLNGGVAYTYQDVPRILNTPNHPHHETMKQAHNLAQALLERRRAAGALAIYDLFRGWATTEDGHIVRLGDTEKNAGYILVQETMIAANSALARWAIDQEVPILYRNHRATIAAPPREQLLDDLHALQVGGGENRLGQMQANLSGVLARATYAPHACPHFGLQLAAYAHTTSPLRRFADFATQRNVFAAIDGDSPSYAVDEMAVFATAINRQEVQRRSVYETKAKERAWDLVRRDIDGGKFRKADPAQFHKIIKVAVRDQRLTDSLAVEIVHRAKAGDLAPRDLQRLLLPPAGTMWDGVRTAAMAALMASPEHAVTAVTLHGQQAQVVPEWAEIVEVEGARFAASVSLAGVVSAVRRAPTKKGARQQAALSLLAIVAGMADPSGDVKVSASAADPAERFVWDGVRNPVMVLHEQTQAGGVVEVDWHYASDGPPHAPHFTCTVTGQHGGGNAVTGSGDGRTKAEAKTQAATAFLRDLSRAPASEHAAH